MRVPVQAATKAVKKVSHLTPEWIFLSLLKKNEISASAEMLLEITIFPSLSVSYLIDT